MAKYWIADENFGTEHSAADDAEAIQAAREELRRSYSEPWEGQEQSELVTLDIYRIGDDEERDYVDEVSILVHPAEPTCSEPEGHDWQGFGSARSSGAGLRYDHVCIRCGVKRTTDTRAQDASTGRVLPGDRVWYDTRDEDAREWAEERQRAKDYETVRSLLAGLIEVRKSADADTDEIAITSIECSFDEHGIADEDSDMLLDRVNERLSPRYLAEWTGDANGAECGISICRKD